MRKRKMLRLLVTLMLSLFLVGCGDEKGDVKVYENTEAEIISHEEQTMTAIVTGIDMENKLVDFVSIQDGAQYSLIYHGGVHVLDSKGKDIGIGSVACGDVLDVTYYGDTEKLVSMQPNGHVSTYTEVKKFIYNSEEHTASYGGKSLKLSDYVKAFDGEQAIALADVNTEDEVTLSVWNGTLLSVVITKGHGYVRLLNQGTYIGGFVEIGKDVIVPVTADMLVAVGEGEYTLRINKNGYSGEKKVKVTRDREINIDISDIAIPSGTVTFAIEPEDVEPEIKVDGSAISGRTFTGLYGEHTLAIKADGYDSFRGSFRINETTKTLHVTLQKDDTSETTEATTEEGTTTGDATTGQSDTTGGTTTGQSDTTGTDTTTGSTTTQSGTEATTQSAEREYKITIREPAGVGVYLDGDYVGIAPVSFKKTAGTHTITLYKAGYLIKSYTIQAVHDGTDDEYSYADLISVLD